MRKELQEGVQPICQSVDLSTRRARPQRDRLADLPTCVYSIDFADDVDDSLQTLHSQSNKHSKILASVALLLFRQRECILSETHCRLLARRQDSQSFRDRRRAGPL